MNKVRQIQLREIEIVLLLDCVSRQGIKFKPLTVYYFKVTIF